jgi:hypothetical protein
MKFRFKEVRIMNTDNLQKFTFNMENEKGELVVKGEIRGESEISFLDDLKCKAVIALLNSIDQQNFSEPEKTHLFGQYITEMEETICQMKQHKHFQGKTN